MKLKYEPLEDYLRARHSAHKIVQLSFAEIEAIIGSSLPRSAYEHRPWWSNQANVSVRPQAKSWIGAGFKVDNVQQHPDFGEVRFVREED